MAADRPASTQRRHRTLYGRRKGHRLRAGQQARLDAALATFGISLPLPGRLDPAAMFMPPAEATWIEIGFGGGEHLAHMAAAHPERDFIGCEPYVNGVASLAKAIEDAGLNNIRLFMGDGLELLDALPAASIAGLFLLFPDPWPKTRHHKRRFIQPQALDALARILRDGAALVFATDHMEYARWTLAHVLAHGAFDWPAEGPRDWRRAGDTPPTRYEIKAAAAGRPSVYLRFVRRPRGAENSA